MAETLQWRLRLREDVFGPASKAQKALRAYQAESNRIARVQRQQQAAMARLNAQAFRRDQQMRRAQERAAASSAARVARANAAAYRRDQALQLSRGRTLARLQARQARENERILDGNAALGRGAVLGMLGVMGGLAVGVAGFGLRIAQSFAEIGLAAGQAVIEVAAFRESSLASLNAVLGNARSAGRAYRNAIVIANQTPLDTRDVIQAQTQLAVSGFRENELTPLLAAFSDVQAARGGEAGQALIRVLGQIRGLGRVNRGDITMQAQTAGLAPGLVFQAIADRMGMTGPNARAQAEAAVGQRRVNSQVAIQAFLDATSRAYSGGGPLGTFARQQSETLTGALSNLRNAGFNLLAQIDFSKIPGVIAFKNAILQITAALDAGSPAGQRLRGIIEGAVNTVGNLFARVNPQTIAEGFGFVQRVIAGVGNGLRAAWPVVRAFGQGFGPAFMAAVRPLGAIFAQLASGGGPSAGTMQLLATAARGMGQALGFLIGTMTTTITVGAAFVAATAAWGATLFGWMTTTITVGAAFVAATAAWGATLFGWITNFSTQIVERFRTMGADIMAGLRNGILSSVAAPVVAIQAAGQNLVDGVKQTLGIQSPSKVFADEVGRWIPAGVEQGITRNTSGMTDALASTLAPPAVPRLGGLGGITIYVNVTEARDARATATAVTEDLELQLGAIFGRLAETT